MKKILLIAILLVGINVSLNAYDAGIKLIPSLDQRPIVKPPIETEKPIRPKPIVRPNNLYGVHHHTYYETIVESDCHEYIEIIKEKDVKIEALLKENARLKEAAQANLQERLKKEYDKEMQKFEDRGK
ncbi:hypothetical protein [Sulfurovum sp.]|uniref:hypothetical protein n=1 Tax=Sulfurovum sp. TaxID=1969726 RepID=UPI0035645E66